MGILQTVGRPLAIVGFGLTALGCVVEASGNERADKYEFKEIRSISLCCGFSATIETGAKSSAVVRGSDNILDLMELDYDEDSGHLDVGFVENLGEIRAGIVEVSLVVAGLESLEASGGSDVTVSALEEGLEVTLSGDAYARFLSIEGELLEASLSGGAHLQVDNLVGDVEVNGDGVSLCGVTGKGNHATATLSGGSRFEAEKYALEEFEAVFSGGSGAKTLVSSRISGVMSGGSRIENRGWATVDVTLSGGSEVQSLE